jgi:phosphopantothenoylcysteine decarboxylase / phosphopantothenate---cysteine ligase
VANDISATDAGFGSESNRVTLLFRNETNVPLELMSKEDVAEIIISHLGRLLENK